jgi:hypothetical protein
MHEQQGRRYPLSGQMPCYLFDHLLIGQRAAKVNYHCEAMTWAKNKAPTKPSTKATIPDIGIARPGAPQSRSNGSDLQ